LSAAALALVLAAAVCHAAWNLALKKARGNGLSFFAVLGILEVIVWSIPVALLTPELNGVKGEWLIAMAVSAIIHMAYFWLLLKAYKSADLSLAYPLARATGPLLSVLAAIVFLGAPQLKGIAFALLCGTMIAAYTVWDQQSVTRLAIPVLVFYWGSILMRIAIASPALWTDRHAISGWFRHDVRVLLVVAVLAPLAYILVLVAMTLAPLSLVAPAREVSILLGVIAGAKLLKEGQMFSRLGAAALMVAGIVLLSIGDRLMP
jgi:drug/metabolite transporter (DMT)-like permease